MEYNFVKKYHKKDTNTTFKYPFDVPEDAEKIEVFIEISQPEKSSSFKDSRPDPIGVGVEYDGVIRSWNCCHKMHLILAEEYGGPGSIPGKLNAGEWKLVIFPRTKNEISEVTVKVTVKITQRHYRYVAGDTHLHTWHSDGTMSVDRLVTLCKESGLEYLFITDHNISSSNYSIPKDKEILVIPGTEYGIEAGHMNILGETTAIGDFTWDPDSKCYKEVFDKVKGTNLGIGMNHPFCNDSPWRLDKTWDFDWVEVWNGMWRPVNDKGVRWWHEQLCKGKRLTAIGGSDNHHENDPVITQGVPTTHAYVNELKGANIVQAFKDGHCYVTLLPIGPLFHMYTKNNIMGDITDDKQVITDIKGLEQGDCVYIITDKSEEEYVAQGQVFQHVFTREDEKFVRVQVKRKVNANHMVDFLDFESWVTILLSNPIYFK